MFSGVIEGLKNTAYTVNSLASRYGSIYIPSDELVTDSLFELFNIFSLYDTGYENLVLYYHTGFDPAKGMPFDAKTLDTVLSSAKEKLGVILEDTDGSSDFKALLGIINRCETLRFEIIAAVDLCFEAWAYSYNPE